MENTADFSHKELCLLLSTICENELGVTLGKNIKDLRAKENIFAYGDNVGLTRMHNKQGKTRVSVFQVVYNGEDKVKHAYLTSL